MVNLCVQNSEAWEPSQFQEKRSRNEKAIIGALGEFRGILGAALGIQKLILGTRNSILGMASHDLSNTKTTILGATPGAILGIDGHPHERFSFAPAFSERFFKNWDGPRAQEEPPQDDSPSTACNSSTVTASGGVRLGRADPPCFGQPPPGIVQVPSRQLPPPLPRPLTGCRRSPTGSAEVYPRQWTPLGAKPKSQPGGPPDGSKNGGTGSGGGDPNIPAGSTPYVDHKVRPSRCQMLLNKAFFSFTRLWASRPE